jgi:hypothetical protein
MLSAPLSGGSCALLGETLFETWQSALVWGVTRMSEIFRIRMFECIFRARVVLAYEENAGAEPRSTRIGIHGVSRRLGINF